MVFIQNERLRSWQENKKISVNTNFEELNKPLLQRTKTVGKVNQSMVNPHPHFKSVVVVSRVCEYCGSNIDSRSCLFCIWRSWKKSKKSTK